MDWIREHYIDVFAAIGACYTAARLIVALTPTKKDDAFVEKAGRGFFGRPVAKMFGLDLSGRASITHFS